MRNNHFETPSDIFPILPSCGVDSEMRSLLLLMACVVVLAGCQQTIPIPPETIVNGEVFLDGKPLEMGVVYLENQEGTMNGQGEIMTDGKFRIPAAPLGSVKAAVRTSGHARFAGVKTKDGKQITVGNREGNFVAVPKKYEDVQTSNLTFTVTKEMPLKIELSSK